MKKQDLTITKISYSLLDVIKKFFEIEKTKRYYGTDQPLFYSEIHIIQKIKENKDIHITGLAENLGVTKGAVSQIVIKLEKKGLLKKERDSKNNSKFLLKLTPLGEIAYLNHLKFHENFDAMLIEILNKASEDNIDFLKNFLATLDNSLSNFDSRG